MTYTTRAERRTLTCTQCDYQTHAFTFMKLHWEDTGHDNCTEVNVYTCPICNEKFGHYNMTRGGVPFPDSLRTHCKETGHAIGIVPICVNCGHYARHDDECRKSKCECTTFVESGEVHEVPWWA
jgi:hypothetical protein